MDGFASVRRRTVKLLILWLVLCCAVNNSSAASATPDKADVRILIDISGSMHKNDPQNLRRPALRMLVGLLPQDSRAGVWTFGQWVNMLVPLGNVDDSWKAKARKAAAKIASPGQFTNIEDVLKRSTADWDESPAGYSRHLILLTDGVVDISKNPALNAASRKRVLEELLPRIKQIQGKIHTIALSERADHELMKTLSRETGGWYQQVNSAEALQRIFLRMFEKVGKPDTLPLKDNRFKVDKSVDEFTLLVFRKEGAKATKIVPPKGKPFTAKKHPKYVSWHQDLGYDLLTVKKPKQGEWRIQAAVDPDNRVMVVTDLKMRSSELPNVMVEGQQTSLDIFFTDHDKLIVNQQFLELVSLIAQPINGAGEGEARTLLDDGNSDDQKAGDGLFSLKVTPHQNAGTVEWVIRAEGKTFEREQRHLFELLPPAVLTSTDISQDGQPTIKISVIPDITLIDSQSLKVEAQMLGANGELQPLMLLPAGGAWEASVDLTKITGKWGVVADIEAKTLDGESVVLTLDPLYIEGVVAALEASTEAPMPEPEVVNEPEVTSEPDPVEEGLLMQGMIFGAGNLVALVIVGGVLWIIRRRRKDLTDLLNDDEKEEEQDAG